MRVCYVPNDQDAPGFYRCLSPARQLKLNGHIVRLPNAERKEMPDGSTKIIYDIILDPPLPFADVWVLQQRKERWWGDFGVNKLREYGVISVSDVDDNYMELPAWNPAFWGTHPYRDLKTNVVSNRATRRARAKQYGIDPKASNNVNRQNMVRCFQVSDALTVSTPYLKDLHAEHNANIRVIRNFVDWDIWEDIKPQYEHHRHRTRIGYLGVFNFREGDLKVIRDVVPKFLKKHPEVDFVANSKEVHDFLDVPARQRITIKEYIFHPQGTKNYPVGRKTAVMDIGLVPLEMNGLNQGKSHLKGMEYNAAGIPFIASPTESYKDYWLDKGSSVDSNGVLAYTEQEWMDWMHALVVNDQLRRGMGQRGRSKAKQHSIQNHWHEYTDFYAELLGDEYTKAARGAIVRGAVQKVSELSSFLRFVGERGLPIQTVVEVGSARGGTFWALSQVADDDALLVSIDIPAGSPLDMRDGKDVYKGRDRQRFRNFIRADQSCYLIDGNSQLIETKINLMQRLTKAGVQLPIDVLFIDADHRYEGVKRDYELYAPLVREGGIIGFHDVVEQNDERSGVHHLWEELKRKHPDTHYEWFGKDDWGFGQWGAIGMLVKEESLVTA